MDDIEKLCERVDEDLKPQVATLARAVAALQDKIEQQTDLYRSSPLSQLVTTMQGEQVNKANPIMQEYRATVRDYAASLKNLQDMLENHSAPAEVSSLDALRKTFKIS